MKKVAVAVAVASLALLAGCVSATPVATDGSVQEEQDGSIAGVVRVFDVNVDGKMVTCIESARTNGYGIALSCDFGATP